MILSEVAATTFYYFYCLGVASSSNTLVDHVDPVDVDPVDHECGKMTKQIHFGKTMIQVDALRLAGATFAMFHRTVNGIQLLIG